MTMEFYFCVRTGMHIRDMMLARAAADSERTGYAVVPQTTSKTDDVWTPRKPDCRVPRSNLHLINSTRGCWFTKLYF